MVYIIINAALAGLLIALSFSIDRQSSMRQTNNSLVNLVLTNASLFILVVLTLAFSKWSSQQLALLFCRLTLMLVAWYCNAICIYLLSFPKYKVPVFANVVRWLLNALAFYFVFISKNRVSAIDFTNDILVIESGNFMGGLLDKIYPVSLLSAFGFLYMVVIPLFTVLMVLVRAENAKSKLDKQRMEFSSLGLLSLWLVIFYINFASIYQPGLRTVFIIGFVPMLFLFVKAANTDEVIDRRMFFRSLLNVMLRYILPAVLAGFIFALLWPLNNVSSVLFVVIYTLAVAGIFVASYFTVRSFSNRELIRDTRYAQAFERDITSIDYNNEPLEITKTVFGIFNKHVDTSSIKILLDQGSSALETVYSSDEEKVTLPMETRIFDTLLSAHHPVVFREWALRDNAASNIRMPLLDMLGALKSDAFIVLNEGRQIIGLIALGKKTSGNAYSQYDYNVFSKLYSNFFVVGYYLKNIMNEAVVGTVNREIRMSGQIITSIQENMDKIKNPKIDAGYRMVPAHNIGGEFVDMIRLSDTRHIFIIGALSGKGIAASMNMVILKSIIRTFLAETTDFKMLVDKVNGFIRESLPKGTFFAGTFGLIDFGSNTLYYINCGSPALFLYTRAYNNVIEIQGEGHILGFAKSMQNYAKVKKVNLAEGDIVLACTDGLIESRSLRGDVFGKGRVQSAMMENSMFSADKMAQFAYDSLVKFTSKELEDDVTVLVLKYSGGK